MFTPNLRCECAQPVLIDIMRKWSIEENQTKLFQPQSRMTIESKIGIGLALVMVSVHFVQSVGICGLCMRRCLMCLACGNYAHVAHLLLRTRFVTTPALSIKLRTSYRLFHIHAQVIISY